MSEIKETGTDTEMERKLGGIAYQFVKLYEQWWDDRQELVKNLSDHTILLKLFVEQISHFKELEAYFRKSLAESMEKSAKNVEKNLEKKLSDLEEGLGRKLSEVAAQKVNNTIYDLDCAAHKAIQIMESYQAEQQESQWKMIGLTIVTAIAVGMMSVWLVMPKPLLPFTQDMLSTYVDGTFIEKVWPKLPEKMRKSIKDVTTKDFNREIPSSLSSLSNNENADNTGDSSSNSN